MSSHPGLSPSVLPSWESLQHVHVIGVCGTLMGAFAASLRRAGLEVTGSDQNVYPPMSDVLQDAGVVLFSGYSAENLTRGGKKPDLVVIGNVISATNVEARAAIDGGYPYTSLPEAMEKLLLPRTKNHVVAGTHGKTTTSSLLAFVLDRAGLEPSYFIGGVSHDLPESFHLSGSRSSGGPFVLEGDEYDTAFWDKVPKFNHYLPDYAILTSVEYDHADIYSDLAAVLRAFEGLVDRIRAGGTLVACTDTKSVDDLAARARNRGVRVLTYGFSEQADYRLGEVQVQPDGTSSFGLRLPAGTEVKLAVNLPGRHNALNATAVWIQAHELLALPADRVLDSLLRFQGVKRRQEERGERAGVLVVDDFAHHPTAVRETLSALRAKYGSRRLIAVFEPRSATSRRKVFQAEYAVAFDAAEKVFIAAPFDQSKIDSSQQFSSDQLVDDLRNRGKDALVFREPVQGVAQVAQIAAAGDVVAVLSNGGFGGFIPLLLEKLSQR